MTSVRHEEERPKLPDGEVKSTGMKQRPDIVPAKVKPGVGGAK